MHALDHLEDYRPLTDAERRRGLAFIEAIRQAHPELDVPSPVCPDDSPTMSELAVS